MFFYFFGVDVFFYFFGVDAIFIFIFCVSAFLSELDGSIPACRVEMEVFRLA